MKNRRKAKSSKSQKQKREESKANSNTNKFSPIINNPEQNEKDKENTVNQPIDTLYNILRVNCIENMPSSIEDIFSLKELNILALCRSDNTIEIWSTNSWVQLFKYPGLKNIQTRRIWLTYKSSSPIDNNIFNNLRLFTIGLNGYFIEWSFETLLPKYTYKNNGGAIWDFKIKNKLCLLASDDGAIRIIKIKKNEDPFIVKQFEKTRSKILSISFENSTNNIFYTGHSTGVINKWDLKTGHIITTINTNQNVKKENEKNLIWTICSINSQYLFAGDSNGRLLILDMNVGNIFQEIYEHKGDILTMTFNNNLAEPIIYYSGVDSLIGCIKYDKKKNNFVFASSFRGQSHDVNALSLIDNNILISGGNTTDICIYHLFHGGNLYQKYEKKVYTNIKRHISPFEHRINYYVTIPNKDKIFFILHQKLDYVDLWNINMNNQINTFVAKIYKSKKIEGNIISSNISYDAKIIAISYENLIVVFNYDYESNEIKKIGTIKYQANFLYINNQYQLLFLSQKGNKLYIYDLIKNENNKYTLNENMNIQLPKYNIINLDNILNVNSFNKNIAYTNQLILTAEYNEKNNMLFYSTLNKQLYCININEKSYESLPHPDKYITKISFSSDNNKIILIDENNYIYFINMASKKFDDWTNKRIKDEDYPLNYIKWYNKIFGICPLDPNRFILFTDYNYILLDTNKEIPPQCIIEKNKMDKYIYSDYEKLIKEYHRILFEEEYNPVSGVSKENKSMFLPMEVEKNIFNLQNDNFKITSRFNSIMLMKKILVNNDENNEQYLLVVENDWNNIVKSFPGAFVKHNYGH